MSDPKKQSGSKTTQSTQEKPDTQDVHRESEDNSPFEADQENLLSDEELITLCKERLCPSCPIKEEKDQEVLMVKADADNYRKRLAREKEQICKFAGQDILEDLIPIIDNLELALEHGRAVEACQDLVQGVDMTRKILLEAMQKHGFQMIASEKGHPFDPAWHEAMGEVDDPELDTGHIAQILQTGYALKDRVLRPAKVMISK